MTGLIEKPIYEIDVTVDIELTEWKGKVKNFVRNVLTI